MEYMIPLLVMAALAGLIAGSFVFLSAILGPKKRSPVKDAPFESGLPSEGMKHAPVQVKFYLVALALYSLRRRVGVYLSLGGCLSRSGWFGFVEMLVFLRGCGCGVCLRMESGRAGMVDNSSGEPSASDAEVLQLLKQSFPDDVVEVCSAAGGRDRDHSAAGI